MESELTGLGNETGSARYVDALDNLNIFIDIADSVCPNRKKVPTWYRKGETGWVLG
jgi:hypothetical protein